MTEYPRYAYVPGKGRCRVLAYTGDGYFDLLTPRDQVLHIHRDRIQFAAPKKGNKK